MGLFSPRGFDPLQVPQTRKPTYRTAKEDELPGNVGQTGPGGYRWRESATKRPLGREECLERQMRRQGVFDRKGSCAGWKAGATKLMVEHRGIAIRSLRSRLGTSGFALLRKQPTGLFSPRGFDPLQVLQTRKPARVGRLLNLVEHRGIEPLTSGLQSPRSPS